MGGWECEAILLAKDQIHGFWILLYVNELDGLMKKLLMPFREDVDCDTHCITATVSHQFVETLVG